MADAMLKQRRIDAEQEFIAQFPGIYHGVMGSKPEQRLVFNAMLKVLIDWDWARMRGEVRPAGVVLLGKVGRGKTALAALLSRYAASVVGLRGSYVNCADMAEDLRGLDDNRRRQRSDYQELVDPAEWPICTIDDIGREAGNEAPGMVRWMLDYRSRAGCFTIGTANLEQPALLTHLGGEREWSRFQALTVVEFPAGVPDYRKARS
jgi:DNA replication protein DnaC